MVPKVVCPGHLDPGLDEARRVRGVLEEPPLHRAVAPAASAELRSSRSGRRPRARGSTLYSTWTMIGPASSDGSPRRRGRASGARGMVDDLVRGRPQSNGERGSQHESPAMPKYAALSPARDATTLPRARFLPRSPPGRRSGRPRARAPSPREGSPAGPQTVRVESTEIQATPPTKHDRTEDEELAQRSPPRRRPPRTRAIRRRSAHPAPTSRSARAARSAAPVTAPTPSDPRRSPNPTAPRPVSRPRTGISAMTPRSAHHEQEGRQEHASQGLRVVARSAGPPGWRRACARRENGRELALAATRGAPPTTPRNDRASSTNTTPGPAAATTSPPRAGPSVRATLMPTPLSVTPAASSSLGRSSGTTAYQAGIVERGRDAEREGEREQHPGRHDARERHDRERPHRDGHGELA